MRYYMFNKPRGVITACSDARHETVMKYFVGEEPGLFPVGRLDKETEGLLLMTDDGSFCYRINTPMMKKEKTYVFYARGEMTEEKLSALCSGVDIGTGERVFVSAVSVEHLESLTLLDVAELAGENAARIAPTGRATLPVCKVRMTITEGKKHQVKRMAGAVGLRVLYLERVNVAGVPLDPLLKRGEYRPLSDEEIEILMK